MRFLLISASIVLLDQLSKQWLVAVLDQPWWLIDGQVGFQLSFNEGVAFSLPITGLLSIVLSGLIIAGLLFFYRRYIKRILLSDVVFALIIGGAVGNLIDRLYQGAVVDFIRIYWWPSFNLADITIVVGFGLLLLCFDRLQK